MASTATLATMEARVKNALMDSGLAIWAQAQIDEALQLALDEYSRSFPLEKLGTITPALNTPETSLSALTGLIRVKHVWFPYVAGTALVPCQHQMFENGGAPLLRLDGASPDGAQVARVLYTAQHTLKDLASAAATTYPCGDDGLLVTGACGYACLMRAIDQSEGDNKDITTPNLTVIAGKFLTIFRFRLSEVL